MFIMPPIRTVGELRRRRWAALSLMTNNVAIDSDERSFLHDLSFHWAIEQPSPFATVVPIICIFLLLTGRRQYRLGRQLWTAHPENEFGDVAGFWENEVLGTWEAVKLSSEIWWRKSWLSHFRMEQETFCFLLLRYGHLLEKQTTHLRRTIPAIKRLAIRRRPIPKLLACFMWERVPWRA